MSNILIPNPSHLQEMITKISHDGESHFHVIADFDRTLTSAYFNGQPRYSLESIFQEGRYLGQEFASKSKENFDKYHPIEIDPTIPLKEKEVLMNEWRTRVFKLMIKYGVKKSMIQDAMKSNKIIFRSGCDTFFETLSKHQIPLLIFSASGLGNDGINFCLEHQGKRYDNIHIISNTLVRDKDGKMIAVQEPIIHILNKGETVVHELPLYEQIKERKNILLLGDALGDADMADGYDYQNIIRIGFLNYDTPEHREQFQKKFDLVILNDGPMDEVNAILQKILG